ncbi:ATP-binding protein [Holophaga foetida]|uniref:ATP-binding protein n=1 Tax=Holophaga foetida TaxID=35839 RepID=UPI00024749D9|nr:ATP-binding protein [Holophaga foetida]
MFERHLTSRLVEALGDSPAVALLGPRQSGKTTLALEVGGRLGAIYLDLESEADRAKLAEPELYLSGHSDRLVILDEVHRAPGLFPVLRGLIDRGRREGRRTGRFLLLGSAALDLLKQSGETLAGRIAFLELGPFSSLEITSLPQDDLWTRGGFPESLLAGDPARSLRWRQDFIRTYLERDIPQFGPRIAAETLRRFWTMLAHHQGGILNSAQFARNLGVDVKTAVGYLDLLVDLLLVRRLAPWHGTIGKRLVKSPKVYVRDSGLVHALLGIPDVEGLLAHPVLGASWEGFVIENLLAAASNAVTPFFYRSSGGAEVDLVLAWPDGTLWAIEIKRSLSPKLERGFHAACGDLDPERRFVVYPGSERYPVAAGVEAVSLRELARMLQDR